MDAIVGALVAAIVAYVVSNRDLSDSLDSKSGWREKLFDVAAKYELTLDDAQTVRAALRIFPDFGGNIEEYSFTWFSNIMIVHLDCYILNSKYQSKVEEGAENRITLGISSNTLQMNNEVLNNDSSKKLNEVNTAIVRLFAMFLLKYHFDYRSSMGAKDYLVLKNRRNKRFNKLVEETYEQYKKILK